MEKKGPKIVFFGTPEFAEVILKSLIEDDFNIISVFSQPDKKIGRKQEIVFSSVKKLALEKNIPLFQPADLDDPGLIEKLGEEEIDLFVVAAYGKILPKKILNIPKFGSINVHASLLPKYRGASPVQSAIFEGEEETGITLIKMNEKMDEGDILVQKKVRIGKNETAEKLLRKLGSLGAKTIGPATFDLVAGKIKPAKQNDSKATYCKTIRRQNGEIDWKNPAEKIYRQWKAYFPWPGIFSVLSIRNKSKRIKFNEIEFIAEADSGKDFGEIVEFGGNVSVQTKKGLLILKKIQIEGKQEVDTESFIKGYPEAIGKKFGKKI